MDFKIPNSPSRTSYVEEIADFWELRAAIEFQRPISKVDIIKLLSVESDETQHEGITAEEDKIDIKLDQVLPEFSKRSIACSGNKYPFETKNTSIEICKGDNIEKYIYLFLLLSTRLDMSKSKNKNQEGIDGTYLFEKLCKEVGENYFGNLSNSYHFGTGNQGGFPEKVEQLIEELEEGRGYRNINDHSNLKNDDGLDVVIWKNFSDEEVGKLIGFGQCKTGTSWQDHVHKLNPKTFCKKWFKEHPILDPIPIFFIADTLKSERNFRSVQVDNLFFNRFRIMEYIPEELPEEIEQDLRDWVNSALSETITEYA